MQKVMAAVAAYFTNEYLQYGKWLLSGYLLAYLVAFLLSKLGRTDRTILFQCRQAWAIALLAHLLFVVGFTIKWLMHYGMGKSIAYFVPLYVVMIILDIFVIANATISLHRVANYQQ